MAQKRMTLKDIQKITTSDISTMTRSQLANYVRNASDIANKRIKRLLASPNKEFSHAIRTWQKQGSRFFKAGGKNVNQLREEFKRVTHFLSLKTSTSSGVSKIRKDLYNTVGRKLSPEEEKELWARFRQYQSFSRDRGISYDSQTELNAIAKVMTFNVDVIKQYLVSNFPSVNVGGERMYINKLNGDVLTYEQAYEEAQLQYIQETVEGLLFEDPTYEDLMEKDDGFDMGGGDDGVWGF